MLQKCYFCSKVLVKCYPKKSNFKPYLQYWEENVTKMLLCSKVLNEKGRFSGSFRQLAKQKTRQKPVKNSMKIFSGN